MTLVSFSRALRSEAVCHQVEVVDRELIVEDIPVLLRGRHAALLAASTIHAVGGGGAVVVVVVMCGRGGPAQPVSNPR